MNPSPDQIRSRQTAMLAERHWWTQKLKAMAEDWRDSASTPPMLPDVDVMLELLASHVEALIAERNPR